MRLLASSILVFCSAAAFSAPELVINAEPVPLNTTVIASLPTLELDFSRTITPKQSKPPSPDSDGVVIRPVSAAPASSVVDISTDLVTLNGPMRLPNGKIPLALQQKPLAKTPKRTGGSMIRIRGKWLKDQTITPEDSE